MSNLHMDFFCSTSALHIANLRAYLLPSLLMQQGLTSGTLHFVDYTGTNYFGNETEALKSYITAFSKQISSNFDLQIKFHSNNQQLGFGEAHNFLFSCVNPNSPFLILNSDLALWQNCIQELLETMNLKMHKDRVALVDCRQFPFEHPKSFNSENFTTNWASGCCLLVNPTFFSQSNFDKSFWMYCEDVDLSWQAWISDYCVLTAPNAKAFHYTGAYFHYESARKNNLENFWSLRNFILLSTKYFGEKGQKNSLKSLKSTIRDEKLFMQLWKSATPAIPNALNFFKKNESAIYKARAKGKIVIDGLHRYHK